MRIYKELDLNTFEAWSGAIDTLDRIRNANKCEELETMLEELYPDGMGETELNDLLWFEPDTVFEWLGLRTETQIESDIQEAGRFCERYASDLFISWNIIEEKLKDYDFGLTSGGKFLFGFRESGVDHKEFVLNQLNGVEYGRYYYRSLWMLDIEISNSYVGFETDSYNADIKMVLQKILL